MSARRDPPGGDLEPRLGGARFANVMLPCLALVLYSRL